jgi:hypothetical protein
MLNGRITAANCAPLAQAGAEFLAASTAVWSHAQGPASAVRALMEAIAATTYGALRQAVHQQCADVRDIMADDQRRKAARAQP